MKKIFVLVSALTITSSSFFFTVQKAAAVSVIDQEYSNTGDASLAIKSHALTIQAFRPSQPRLDKVSVNLTNTSGTANCGVSKFNGSDWDPVIFINDQAIGDGWNTFDFPDFDVEVNGRYRIWMDASTYDTQWYYSAGNPYPRGAATWDNYSDHSDEDFQFRTYGYGPEVPATEQSSTTSTPTTSTTNSSTNSASVETLGTTTTSITKPLNLAAVYSETEKGIKLTWKASTTTNIEGYKIFRSELVDKGFTKVGQTDKSKLDFSDLTIEPGKTYYYQVRAFEGTSQSVSSNVASAIVPANAVVAPKSTNPVTLNTDIPKNRYEMTPLLWALSAGGVILLGLFTLLILRRRQENKKSKTV